MAEIKVGQKYKLTYGSFAGHEVEIIAMDPDFLTYKPGLYEDSGSWRVKDFLHDWEPVEEPRPVGQEDNQLSPNVYQFPNGVEVRHISAHLTSFGGQAVQYIARATRLDGVVKGLPVQDLKKAIQLLEWEVDRLEAGK